MYERIKVNTLPKFKNVNDNYTIDNYGVLRADEKVIKQGMNNKGYMYVALYVRKDKRNQKNRYIREYTHRLVAMAFLVNEDIENKTEIDHINGIKDDNRVCNLRWVSRKENMNNAITKENMIGNNSNGKCYVYDYRCRYIGEFKSLTQASIYTNVSAKFDRKVGQYFFLSINDARMIPKINKKCKANSIIITHIHTNEKHYFYSNREARKFFNNKVNISDAIKYNMTIYGLYKVRNLNYKKLIDSLDL